MKVLMVYTNTYRMFAPAPLGASLVASRLRADGHDVRFLDLMFVKSPAAEAARVARDFQPDLIGYSIRNRDNQMSAALFDPLPMIRSIVSAVRAVRPVPVLLGGTAFTTFPRQWMDALDADYGMTGDDLASISRFVASLAVGSPDLAVPGLVHRAGGSIRRNRSPSTDTPTSSSTTGTSWICARTGTRSPHCGMPRWWSGRGAPSRAPSAIISRRSVHGGSCDLLVR